MWRKFSWGLTILYNIIRIPVLNCINFGKIKSNLFQIISPKAKIRVSDNGIIKIAPKITIEEGTLVRATNGKISIGTKVYINRNCNIISRESIKIGDGTTIGPNVCIYDHDHSIFNKNKDYILASIEIGENVWIGANAIILKGVKIGNGSVIGAGAIIAKNIEPYTIVTSQRELKIKQIYNINN